MQLKDAVRDLSSLPRQAVIYVPQSELAVGESTSISLLLPDDERPSGWRYLLEVLIAREVLEVWSAWRGNRIPTTREASEAIVYYAENDAYQPED
ncbi:hypothetical protein [Actinomadura luteofluorescens]